MNLELHVERLILHRCALGDRERVAASLRNELGRLIAKRGLLPSVLTGADIARIDGGSLRVRQGATADSQGREIARAVFGCMHNE